MSPTTTSNDHTEAKPSNRQYQRRRLRPPATGVVRHPILGGLINEYYPGRVAIGEGERSSFGTPQACDFFHIDCAMTLQRLYVFFVIEINTRYVDILGATTNPDGPWTARQARNLIADLGERAHEFRFLPRDRAGQFTSSVDSVFTDAGITVVKIPPRLPQANGYAERFVRTVTADPHGQGRTDRPDDDRQRHLQRVLAEYVRHYNQQRPHRGQALRPPTPARPAPTDAHASVIRIPILGGLINEYHPSRLAVRKSDAPSSGTPQALRIVDRSYA